MCHFGESFTTRQNGTTIEKTLGNYLLLQSRRLCPTVAETHLVFRKHLAIPLVTVELAYRDDFDLPPATRPTS